MAVNQTLKNTAQQIRDEVNVGGNTALRVGQLLMDMVDEIGNAGDASSLKTIVQTIFAELGNYCFPNGKPTIDWNGGGSPVLLSPANGSSVNVGEITYNGSTVTKTITIQGSNLTEALTIAVTGTGLSASANSVSAADANGGTTITITYTNATPGAASTSGTLTISSSEVSASVSLTATKAAQGAITIDTSGLVNLTSDAPGTVTSGDPLDVTLTVPSNLYVIDDDTVVVTMGGVTQPGAYDSTTGKITIASVTGTVVISATAITYVSSGLVLMFDGKNRGGSAGQWNDLVDTSRSVALTGGDTENDDNILFDGSGYGMGSFVDNVTYNVSTAECVIKQTTAVTSGSNGQVILLPGKTGAPILAQFYNNGSVRWSTHAKAASDSYTASRSIYAFSGTTGNKYSISYYGNTMLQNGSILTSIATTTFEDAFNTTNHLNKTAVGAQITGGGTVLGFKGNIYCIRLYSRVLTDAEAQQNWKVDQKRFNI